MKAWPLLAIALLAGCNNAYIDSRMLAKANEVCAPNGGVDLVRVGLRYRGVTWVEGECLNKLQYRFAAPSSQ